MAEVREPEQLGVSKTLVNFTDKFASPRQCDVTKHRRIKEKVHYTTMSLRWNEQRRRHWGRNGEWLWIFCTRTPLAEMYIDDTSKSNDSTYQDTLARVREQTCTVCNLNRIKIITLIMSNISRIGITLHATKLRSATSPLRVLLLIALDFVSWPLEFSPVKHTLFTHSSCQFK